MSWSASNNNETYPGGNPWANLKLIFHRYYLREVAFAWELTKETIYLPVSCLQGGVGGKWVAGGAEGREMACAEGFW